MWLIGTSAASLRQGVVAQGWPLRVSAHSSAHAECTLGSNREALLTRLSSTVARFGFTASPLHPFAKAIAQVDATVYRCRFCRPGAVEGLRADHTRKDERSHSLDRSQRLLSGLHRVWLLRHMLDVQVEHRHRLRVQTAGRPERPDRGYAGIRRVPTGHVAFAVDTRRYTSRPLHGCNHLRDVQESLIAIDPYCGCKASSVPQNSRRERKDE
jgi:hypothetical protein